MDKNLAFDLDIETKMTDLGEYVKAARCMSHDLNEEYFDYYDPEKPENGPRILYYFDKNSQKASILDHFLWLSLQLLEEISSVMDQQDAT